MSTSTRVTRSKGESDGPMRMRLTRRDVTSGRNGGTALSTSGREHQQQMPTQMPHLTQLPEATPEERTTTAPMLPPGPQRSLTPCMPLPTFPASSLHSSAPLFQENGYSSTSEEESEVTFTHGRSNGTFPNQHAERTTSTPTPSDYTTQGDPDASSSGLFKPDDINDKYLGTNNFFVPDGSNRWIHQIDNKVFHAGYLENGNNAYLLELPALENMLNTRKFLMDEMSGQFYAVYGNSYQRMSTKPMLQQAWAIRELIDELGKLSDILALQVQHHHWPWERNPLPIHRNNQMICCPDNWHQRLFSTSLHLLDSPDQRNALQKMRGYRYTTITYQQSLA